MAAETADSLAVLAPAQRRRLGAAVGLATAAVAAFVSVELYVAGGGALRGTGLAASYLSGMTMLVLPCTLPMVLVVVPLALGSELRRGIVMALAFGAGVSVTLAAYGAVVALAGSSIGSNSTTRVMWFIGGIAAWVFGCSQFGLFSMRIPSFGVRVRWRSGRSVRPGPLQALGLGLLLGNAGLGCPCPAWYLLLTGVATSGKPGYGAAIGLAQGLGRVTPVIALAIAAMLGVDATAAVIRHRRAVENGTGMMLVVLGAAIVVFMALAHPWWEATAVHWGWNHLLSVIGGPQLSEVSPGGGPLPAGYWWAPWSFAALVAGPLVAVLARHRTSRRRVAGFVGKAAVGEPA